jgi:hypothetical protein
MSVNILEVGRVERVGRDRVGKRRDHDGRPFGGVALGVAAGALVWLGLAWVLRGLF